MDENIEDLKNEILTLVGRAGMLEREGYCDLAEPLRVQSDLVLDRIVRLRRLRESRDGCRLSRHA